MTSSSEQPPKEYTITEEEVEIIESHLDNKHCQKCPYEGGGVKSGIKSFIRSRPHPALDNMHPDRWAQLHDAAIARKAREGVLNRLDKEIATRENEMNRKGNLEDNLTTATGYLTAAGALNWVRVVLIDGSRDTIDGDSLRSTTPQTEQEQPR